MRITREVRKLDAQIFGCTTRERVEAIQRFVDGKMRAARYRATRRTRAALSHSIDL